MTTRSNTSVQTVKSNCAYPPEYQGPKSIRTQVEALLMHFPHLDATWALDRGQVWYDSIKPNLPKWIEGPLVYVWWEVFGGYNAALRQVLDRIAATRTFYNYLADQIGAERLRQLERTASMERAIKARQSGDLIVVPSQAGAKHRGRSVFRARERFAPREFGLGSVVEGCRALTHPERYVRWDQLQTDLAGDEYRRDADGEFSRAPCLYFLGGWVGFFSERIVDPYPNCGSASAFSPFAPM